MCELFGISCNTPVGIRFTWRGFLERGIIHKNGWGSSFLS
ncbi:MAG: class II glutamine amidotransferase [Candidatus Bathyarchaeia archaeon]